MRSGRDESGQPKFSSDVTEMPGSPVPNLAGCAKFAEIWAAGIIADHRLAGISILHRRREPGGGERELYHTLTKNQEGSPSGLPQP